MAGDPGQALSRVLTRRRWDDYASLKQYYQNTPITEVIISGVETSPGALAEIQLIHGGVLDYIGAEGQVYIRTEADDVNQHSKYVYIEYQDDTGAIATVCTDDMNAADSTTEETVSGASDFYRLRRMISEVESDSGGGKAVCLTDAAMAGFGTDMYGYIDDGNSQFTLQRFFIQPNATARSFLGRIRANATIINEGDNGATGFIIKAAFTPRVVTDFAEDQVAADISLQWEFNEVLDVEPLIELEGGTEVIFYLGDNGTAGEVYMEFTLLEVYD